MKKFVLPKGQVLGFKALPPSLSLERKADSPPSYWSALYPQLTLEYALNYLPNQFDRGFTEAFLVKIVSKRDFPILVYDDPLFLNGTISNAEKAKRLWDAFSAFSDETLDPAHPLMPALGILGYSVCILDADDYELAVPHSLLSEDTVDIVPLFKILQHPKHKGMIGSVDGLEVPKHSLGDYKSLARILESHLEEYEASFILNNLKQ